MQYQSSPQTRQFARALRQQMTDGERLLWRHLQHEQLGYKFRKQHPIGRYIVDFACLQPSLIVEQDGSQHAAQDLYDQHRDAFLKAQGFAVLRFPSNAIFQNLDGVLSTIQAQLHSLSLQPPPLPSPKGGGSFLHSR
ncbi:MAG: endonuclease domain-containing protein [Brachymonas sp.]